MALTLEQINKNKQQKKNTLNLNSSEKPRPYEVKKGELTKPDPVKKLDEKLEKIEKKTNKLIEKHEKMLTTKTPQTSNKIHTNTTQAINKPKREASYFTYICMPPRKLPRKILDHVKDNAFHENGEWYSKIDSYELSAKVQMNSHQVSNTVRQLKIEGFFEVIESSTSGYRLLKINPETFGIKAQE